MVESYHHIVYSVEEIDSPRVTLKPEFLHQFIEDEIIRGYEDPELHFYFAPITLDCYISYKYKSRTTESVNLESYFEEFFKEHLIVDRRVFEKIISSQNDFKIPATLFNTITRDGKEFETYIIDDITNKEFQTFNYKMQVMLKFFIETSSIIEEDDTLWKVAFMIEKVIPIYKRV